MPGELDGLAEYRRHVFLEGSEDQELRGVDGKPLRGSISRDAVLKVLSQHGQLSTLEYLHCRVRYFCDGAVLGSREFVERLFRASRDRFGPRRTTQAHPMQGLKEPGLFTIQGFRSALFG